MRSRRRRSIRGGRSRICRSPRAMWSRSSPALRATPDPGARRGHGLAAGAGGRWALDLPATWPRAGRWCSSSRTGCTSAATWPSITRCCDAGGRSAAGSCARRATRRSSRTCSGASRACFTRRSGEAPAPEAIAVGRGLSVAHELERRVLRSARRRDPRARRLGGTGSVDADAGALRDQALERNGPGRRRAGANRFAARCLRPPGSRWCRRIAAIRDCISTNRSARTSPCRCCRG